MEFKGTKGKWKVESTSVAFEVKKENRFVKGESELSVTVSLFLNTNSSGLLNNSKSIENAANALLISKAPEMLEMLKELSIDFDVPPYLCERINHLIKEATEL